MRHYLCSVMCTDWFICAWEVAHTGSSPCKTSNGIFFPSRAIRHHYCYYLFTAVFRNEKQTHIYMRTQATQAINMKYCLIEDIVLKTLPRAFFFPRFLLFVIYLLFPPTTTTTISSLRLFNRLHFEPSNPPRDEEKKKIIIIKGNK